ncbi:MAG: hypothetical protein ACM3N9_05280, partial [Syntrophothermus sp.]
MKIKINTIILFCILIHSENFGQNWLKWYPNSISLFPISIFEDYDKGYFNAGRCYLFTTHTSGWIMKTDINGNELWHKYFGTASLSTVIKSGKLLINGNRILIGGTQEYQNKMCPVMVKINPC